MIDLIRKRVQESIEVKRAFGDDLIERIQNVAVRIIEAYRGGQKVIFMGNGGSAADAQHLAAELVGRFAKDRTALPALALNANTSSLTAIGNDYAYDQVFSKQIEAFANPGDIVIGISTSGRSKNILEAVKRAKQKGAITVALTGESGGLLKSQADILLNVPSETVARIQEAHILVGHIICELVESALFP
jgi:D-sedoheptulose 7-phosphate isomerase